MTAAPPGPGPAGDEVGLGELLPEPAAGVGRWPAALRSPLGLMGLAIALAWVAVAVFAPLIAPEDPLSQAFSKLQPPSSHNLMGTDAVGRDGHQFTKEYTIFRKIGFQYWETIQL